MKYIFDETSQEYKLTFKHGQEEVTAKNLKYDCQLNDVQLKGKQVVHYTGLEKDIPDNVVGVTFNRKIIYDKVTKQKVSLSAWQPEKYYLPLVATPAVLDYTPDKAVIGGEAVTVQNLSMSMSLLICLIRKMLEGRRLKSSLLILMIVIKN